MASHSREKAVSLPAEYSGFAAGLIVYADKIVIRRKGLMGFAAHGIKGDKEIPIQSITAIQIKKPGMTQGYIQFSVLGEIASKGGLMAAADDENTIMMYRKHYDGLLEAKAVIEQLRRESREPRRAPSADGGGSSADEIEKLAQLLDRGLLTREEFDAQKRRVLGT